MRLFRTAEEERSGLWKRALDLALTDVRVLAGGLDHETFEQLEERLLSADFGVKATLHLVDHVEGLARQGKVSAGSGLREALRGEVARILEAVQDSGLAEAADGPTVYVIVGVNGVGKTMSVAKLAHRITGEGRSVLVAAGDTFRAGAVSQLEEWARRTGAELVRGSEGADPAAVAFDALEAARARGTDVVLVDTAGRLHTHRGLMDELRKLDRVIRRRIEGAPHETLLVLDATVGQNAVSQVREFQGVVSPTGIILAKLDSTARGGIVVALAKEFDLGVKLVGVGEAVEDLEPFDPEAFLAGVFEGP